MPDLLLHICCAPCLCWPHKELTGEGIRFTGLWFNPNIHPYVEYTKRRDAVKAYAAATGIEVVCHDEYPLEATLQALAQDRCAACYRLRLERTALTARERGFAAFSTTLLYSIYQRHDLVIAAGNQAAQQYNVEFRYRDFRTGWKQGRELARAGTVYRQKYCGCIFSERDRYLGNTHERSRGKGPATIS
ncbi:MAG TPA: epoxyqueuosine reductase QueH [Candidatus Edwardsbacteria bacterium]|nr:epoxyqueuosine reductase QueH [Candidatus Edwardsbacteria bacterium]